MQGSPIAVGKGMFTVIDTKYWGEIQAMGSWHVNGWGYVQCSKTVKKKVTTTYLHIWIYRQNNPNYNGMVDHIDLNRLNNFEDNLRSTDKSLNGANRNLNGNNTSTVKGVSWHKAANKWEAYIDCNDRINLGYFDTLEEATEVRQAAAIRYFGEFAREL